MLSAFRPVSGNDAGIDFYVKQLILFTPRRLGPRVFVICRLASSMQMQGTSGKHMHTKCLRKITII